MVYDNLTDEELVNLARSNEKDTVALEKIINKYKHAVNSVARSYFLNSGDSDDLIQEGMIGLFKAINTYDGSKSSFSNYVYLCIKSSIISAIKKSNAFKNVPLNNYVSIYGLNEDADDKNSAISDLSFDPEETFINRETANELKVCIKNVLSSLEFKILVLYLEGYTYAEIGERVNKPLKSIDNAIQRIRKKIVNIENKR